MSDQTHNAPVVAVTGVTGFVGGHVLDKLLAEGCEVRALVRRPQKPRDGVTWISGGLGDADVLADLCAGADSLIHIAGLTKAMDRDGYFAVNHLDGIRLFDAAQQAGVRRVVNVSSLSAREPGLSHYGASKRALDDELASNRWGFDWVSLRPPAIYGPAETGILVAIKMARSKLGLGIYPAPSGRSGRAGFIHVHDLARAMVMLISAGPTNIIAEIDDGSDGGYSTPQIAAAMCHGSGAAHIIYLPAWLKSIIGNASDIYMKLSGKPSMTSSMHMTYLSHPDWSVWPENRLKLDGFSPEYDLMKGMAHSIAWYKEHGLLR